MIGLIILSLVLITFFGIRTIVSYIRIQQTGLQPGVTDVEAIRGWMTIPYIATAYGVPEKYIFEQIGLPIVPLLSVVKGSGMIKSDNFNQPGGNDGPVSSSR